MDARNSCRSLLAYLAVVAVGVLALWLAFGPLGRLSAEEGQGIAWHDDLAEAWVESRQSQRPMLILITTGGCTYCTKMKAHTFRDPGVARAVGDSFVAVSVDNQTAAILVEQLIRTYPTTVIISPSTAVLDQVTGYLAAEELRPRLSTALERYAQGDTPTRR